MLFEQKDRTLDGGAGHGVGPFSYLDQSSRVEAQRVRDLIERLLSAYDAAGRTALERRLRSDELEVHNSAFFELCLYGLFSSSGFRVEAIEPEVPGSERRPDFLVCAPSAQRFYLEAVLATGVSVAERRSLRFQAEVRRSLDGILHDDFLLELHESRVPGTQVRTAEIRRKVEAWLKTLTKSDVEAARRSSRRDLYTLQLTTGDAVIEIGALPRRNPMGRRASRGLGVISHGVRSVEFPSEAVRSRVKKKAGRYGSLDLPYYVAVNATNDYVADEDFDDALFGTLAYVAAGTGTGYADRVTRLPDGVFMGGGGPTFTRVSGVLCFKRLEPWRVAQCQTRVVENPWAKHPLSLEPLGLPLSRVQADRLTTLGGRSLRDAFELAEGWPE